MPSAAPPSPLPYRSSAGSTPTYRTRDLLRRVPGYLVPYRWRLLAYTAALVTSAVATVTVPLLTRSLINHGLVAGNSTTVVHLGLVALGAGLVAAATGSVGGLLGFSIGVRLTNDLRVALYRHLQSLPLAFFARAQSGAIQSRINNDVIDAQALIQNLFGTVASNLLTLIIATAAMWALSPMVTALALLATPLLVVPARHYGPGVGKAARRQTVENASMNALLAERFNVQGALLFSLAGHPEADRADFEARVGALRDAVMDRNRAFFRAAFFFAALSSLAYGAVYLYGGWRVAENHLSIGTVVALAGLVAVAYGPITSFAQGGISLSPGLVAFGRVFEVLDFPPAVAEPARPVKMPRPVSGVAFRNVVFSHPRAPEAVPDSLRAWQADAPDGTGPVLRGISFEAPAGAMTALVGPTGAGKTTITLLVPRLYDVNEGAVTISGTNVRDMALDEVRAAVGMVTQDAYLLNASLADNLRVVNPDATEGQLSEALERASLGSLIGGLPAGLATVVGDRGYRLSGGEKQRVALARLFLSQADVVVLDEATAHLDTETEAAVQEALEESRAGRTLIVVAHRLSTVRHADQILVVDRGEILERGRHEDLMDRGSLYPRLYRTGLETSEESLS